MNPYAMFDYMDLFFAQWLCTCGQCDHQPVFKTITWLLLSRLPRRNSLEPSEPCLRTYTRSNGTLRNLLPEPTPARAGTLRNLPIPSRTSGTFRNPPEASGTCLWNLHQHTPELAGTLRNPPKPTPAPELPGTLRHFVELSGTLRNLPLEPTPAHAGTLRNLSPEPAPATRTGTHRSLSGLKTP